MSPDPPATSTPQSDITTALQSGAANLLPSVRVAAASSMMSADFKAELLAALRREMKDSFCLEKELVVDDCDDILQHARTQQWIKMKDSTISIFLCLTVWTAIPAQSSMMSDPSSEHARHEVWAATSRGDVTES
ncbi:hypothetical protein CRENBAI_014874 [Crenichthys baileyi]|uniref:Uncharacterized protein n=1 Tax=Crenichthys baileyi TaxID=28760 RepID=A0AAV9SBE8_9TELE